MSAMNLLQEALDRNAIPFTISIPRNPLKMGYLHRTLAHLKLIFQGMNTTQWSSIPSKLRAEGFSVLFDRISYEPQRPLWCARACRGGRQWSTFGKDLSTALTELGKQTLDTRNDLRELKAHETTDSDHVFQQVG